MSDTVQVACPSCLTANRVLADRLGEGPACGRCGKPLLTAAPAELDEAGFDALVARTGLPVRLGAAPAAAWRRTSSAPRRS